MIQRVLIFSTDDFLYPAGGAEVAIEEISKRMPSVSFTFICAKLRKKSPSYEKIGNVEIHRIGFGIPKLDGILLALFGSKLAKKLHIRSPFDISWAVMASYGAFAALDFKRKSGVPYLLTLQEGDSLETIKGKTRFVSKKFSSIFKEAAGLQAISSFLFEWGKRMGFKGACGRVIPNGVDIKMFADEIYVDQTAKIKNSFGFLEGAKIIITASRLESKNGVEDIIKSLPLLPAKVCLVVCGGGSLEEKLKNLVHQLLLQDRVKFLGFVERERLPLLFKSSDVFVRPSLSEGLGSAFLEAMAAGIPVIGTSVGGIPDFLIDPSSTSGQAATGFFCEPQNPKSVAQTIEKVLTLSSQEKETIISRAQSIVKEKYDWDKIGKEMESMFECVYTNARIVL